MIPPHIILGDSLKTQVDIARQYQPQEFPNHTLELTGGTFESRKPIRKCWTPIPLQAQQTPDGVRADCLCDAIGCGIVDGWSSLVSESAVVKLSPYIGQDCEFLPVEISGLEQPYYAFYITRIIDALDEERTKFSEPISYFGGKRRIQKEVFLESSIRDAYVFRLPGWKYTPDHLFDYATSRFFKLVIEQKVSGFQFFESLVSGAKRLYPVDCC